MRSLTLYDKDNELMGILDYVEFDGDCAVPVEYRKGRAPRVDAELWEVDRIQLGLQAHLLKSAGYHVEQVGVYYSQNNEKRYFPADKSLVSEAIEKASRAKKAARSSTQPTDERHVEMRRLLPGGSMSSVRNEQTFVEKTGQDAISAAHGRPARHSANRRRGNWLPRKALIFRDAEMRPVKELLLQEWNR